MILTFSGFQNPLVLAALSKWATRIGFCEVLSFLHYDTYAAKVEFIIKCNESVYCITKL